MEAGSTGSGGTSLAQTPQVGTALNSPRAAPLSHPQPPPGVLPAPPRQRGALGPELHGPRLPRRCRALPGRQREHRYDREEQLPLSLSACLQATQG